MPRFSSHADVSAFCRKHDRVIHDLTDVMFRHNMSPHDGEEVLAWLLGLSRGLRQASILDDNLHLTIARAWQLAVEESEQ